MTDSGLQFPMPWRRAQLCEPCHTGNEYDAACTAMLKPHVVAGSKNRDQRCVAQNQPWLRGLSFVFCATPLTGEGMGAFCRAIRGQQPVCLIDLEEGDALKAGLDLLALLENRYRDVDRLR